MPNRFAKYSTLILINVFFILFLLFVANLIASKIVSTKQTEIIGASSFDYREKFIFYEKYANQLNHLRHLGFLGESNLKSGDEKNFLFSTIGAGPTKILIQGDSWAERMLISQKALNILERYSSENSISIIDAGISSYAPTPMKIQLRILRNDFNIHPSKIIAIIDQTDIGDEIFRYKSLQYQNKQGNLALSRDSENEPFDVTVAIEKLKILYSEEYALKKLFDLYRMNHSKKIEFKEPRVTWTKIASPLYGELNKEEKSYFELSLRNYINYVFSDDSVEELVIVTHNHRFHETGAYKVNVQNIVSGVVNSSEFRKKIKSLHFDKNNYKGLNRDAIYLENDPASHLTLDAQGVFMENILKQLN